MDQHWVLRAHFRPVDLDKYNDIIFYFQLQLFLLLIIIEEHYRDLNLEIKDWLFLFMWVALNIFLRCVSY